MPQAIETLQAACFTRQSLETLLDELFPWLNTHLPIDKKKPLTPDDVAHIGLTPAEMAALPAHLEWDAWRRVCIKHFAGFEFWQYEYTMPPIQGCGDLRRRITWKLTGNTVALFK